MHELAVAQAIVAAAERSAEGRPVSVVRVRLGRLRQVVPEYLSFYFEVAARETVCEEAELECERVASLLRCGACGAEWDPAAPPAETGEQLVVRFRCPECESADHRVLSGDELVVESIDVTEGEPAGNQAADVGGSPHG
jgi:hydrogenase nickel incorporation protein HypA/HybF